MAGKENAFTGPYQHDIGQGNSATISAALTTLRDQTVAGTSPPAPVLKEGEIVRAQAANRGSVVGKYVYFRHQGGKVTQTLLNDLLGPLEFPSWPAAGVDGFTLVYDPNWWPIEHGDMPAFQTKRQSYSGSIGGDYVRGSTEAPIITATVFTVVLINNVASIRTTVNTAMTPGQVIQVSGVTPAVFNGRWTISDVISNFGYISFPLVNPDISSVGSSGTVVTIPPILLNAVLKYPTTSVAKRNAVAGQSLLYVQPVGYDTVQVEWNWPSEDGHTQDWGEVCLVRSMFGVPTTPNDGQVVFGPSSRNEWLDADGDLMISPVMYDRDLRTHLSPDKEPVISGGFWFYYTLFFNISPHAPDLGDWVIGSSDWVQLPQDFRHIDHLWDSVPPFYQWTDDNLNMGQIAKGPLHQFLSVFGFELDFTRQSVEFLQDMYHTDISPMPLLRELGRNLGADDEQGLGDIRFRAGMSDLAERLSLRGTQKGLQQTIETMSKYDTDITKGGNMMLLPDDASPFFSTGNWAGPHPSLVAPLTALPGVLFDSVVAWDKVQLEARPPEGTMPGISETGFMRIKASVTGNVLVTCGCGKIDPPVLIMPPGTKNLPGEYIPLTNAIPVDEGGQYGFMAYLRNSVSGTTPYVVIMWFNQSGQPNGVLGTMQGTPPAGGAPVGSFARHAVQDIAPVGTAYMVPAIHVTARPDVNAYVDMTAAMVYQLQAPGEGFTITPPDRLLTLGSINEQIGAPPKPGDALWTGYVMGAPAQDKNEKKS